MEFFFFIYLIFIRIGFVRAHPPTHKQETSYNIIFFKFFFTTRLFSIKRCARCQGGIGACDLVMRAKDLVYHVECFACYACGSALCKGDYYGIRDGAVFCRPDYERIGRRDTCEPDPMCSPPRAAGHHWPSAHKGRPRKKRTAQMSPMMTAAERNRLAELNVLRIPQSTLGTVSERPRFFYEHVAAVT